MHQKHQTEQSCCTGKVRTNNNLRVGKADRTHSVRMSQKSVCLRGFRYFPFLLILAMHNTIIYIQQLVLLRLEVVNAGGLETNITPDMQQNSCHV